MEKKLQNGVAEIKDMAAVNAPDNRTSDGPIEELKKEVTDIQEKLTAITTNLSILVEKAAKNE